MDVREVTHARVRSSQFDRGDDFLREHRLDRVAQDADRRSVRPQRRQLDGLRGWSDGVAEVDVEPQLDLCCREPCRHRHPHAGIQRVIPNHRSGDRVGQELHAVVRVFDRGDLSHAASDGLFVGGHVAREGVGVDRGTAGAERSQQHPALQDEVLGVR